MDTKPARLFEDRIFRGHRAISPLEIPNLWPYEWSWFGWLLALKRSLNSICLCPVPIGSKVSKWWLEGVCHIEIPSPENERYRHCCWGSNWIDLRHRQIDHKDPWPPFALNQNQYSALTIARQRIGYRCGWSALKRSFGMTLDCGFDIRDFPGAPLDAFDWGRHSDRPNRSRPWPLYCFWAKEPPQKSLGNLVR